MSEAMSEKMKYINKVVINGVDSTQYYEPSLDIPYELGFLGANDYNYRIYYKNLTQLGEYKWLNGNCNRIQISGGSNSNLYLLVRRGLYLCEWEISEENGTIVSTTTLNNQEIKLYWGQSSIGVVCNTQACCFNATDNELFNCETIPDTLKYLYNGTKILKYIKGNVSCTDTASPSNCTNNKYYYYVLDSSISSDNINKIIPYDITAKILKYNYLYLQFGSDYSYFDSNMYFSSPPQMIGSTTYDHIFLVKNGISEFTEIKYNGNYGIVAFKYGGNYFERIN